MTHPQIGALYTYWCDPDALFIVTRVTPLQINLRKIDNGKEVCSTRSHFEDRYTPLCDG